MNIKHAFLAAFAITIGIITYYDVKQCKQLPWPPRFIAAGLAFGLMDLFSFISEELAGLLALGIVLAAIVNKGFVSDCNHTTTGTGQPATTTFIGGSGTDQPASSAAFQSGQGTGQGTTVA